jgi:hypothetical protein
MLWPRWIIVTADLHRARHVEGKRLGRPPVHHQIWDVLAEVRYVSETARFLKVLEFRRFIAKVNTETNQEAAV